MAVFWSHSPRRLRVVFFAAMALLTGTLGWLGWSFLRADEQEFMLRAVTRRETAADLAVAALDKYLTDVELQLDRVLSGSESPPFPGAVVVEFVPGAIRAWPRDGLAYYPDSPATSDVSDALAIASTASHFLAGGHPTEALQAYRRL